METRPQIIICTQLVWSIFAVNHLLSPFSSLGVKLMRIHILISVYLSLSERLGSWGTIEFIFLAIHGYLTERLTRTNIHLGAFWHGSRSHGSIYLSQQTCGRTCIDMSLLILVVITMVHQIRSLGQQIDNVTVNLLYRTAAVHKLTTGAHVGCHIWNRSISSNQQEVSKSFLEVALAERIVFVILIHIFHG